MHGQPADSAKNGQRRCRGKGGCPSEAVSNPRRQRCGDCSANLSSHVDHTGEDAGAATCDLVRDRPEGALREIESSTTARKDETSKLRTVDLRSQDQEDRSNGQRSCGKTAATYAKAVTSCKSIAERSSHQAADSHQKKWQHGIP